jgi:hypothetical protein
MWGVRMRAPPTLRSTTPLNSGVRGPFPARRALHPADLRRRRSRTHQKVPLWDELRVWDPGD